MNETYPMYKIMCKLHDIKIKTWNFNKKFELPLAELKKKNWKKNKDYFFSKSKFTYRVRV